MKTTQLPTTFIVTLFTAFCLGRASLVHATYVLEQGHGADVCEAYSKALNAFGAKMPLLTQRPPHFGSKEIKAVEWARATQALPANATVELFWERDANPGWYLAFPDQWAKWRGTKAQIQEAKRNYLDQIGTDARGYHESVSFRVVEVDVDNDGQSDKLLQFKPGPLATLLLVLSPDSSAVDYKKSAVLLRHDPWSDKSSRAFRKQRSGEPFNPAFKAAGLEPIEDALHGAQYSLFLYAGRTYFDLWWLQNSAQAKEAKPTLKDWRLRVFVAQGRDVDEVCTFRFEFSLK